MTIHCAIMYFDSGTESLGYLLGSDSRAAIKEMVDDNPQASNRIFQVDKSFLGRETVGFIRGTIPGDGNDPIGRFSRDMQSLENLFDGIDEGVDYSSVPLLQDSEQYVLMVAKQTNGFLDLYTVSNAREKDSNLAKRLHRLTPEMYHTKNETLLWYAPNNRYYLVISVGKKFDAKEAQDFLEKLLKIPSSELRRALGIEEDYELGKTTLYRLNFQGIQRINPNI